MISLYNMLESLIEILSKKTKSQPEQSLKKLKDRILKSYPNERFELTATSAGKYVISVSSSEFAANLKHSICKLDLNSIKIADDDVVIRIRN
jgi:hypothetical protein